MNWSLSYPILLRRWYFRDFLLFLFLSRVYFKIRNYSIKRSLDSWTSGSFSSLLEFSLAHEFSSRGLSPFLIRAIRWEIFLLFQSPFLIQAIRCEIFLSLQNWTLPSSFCVVTEGKGRWRPFDLKQVGDGTVMGRKGERSFYLREDESGRENEQTRRGSVGRNTTGREEDLLRITWHLCWSSLYFSLKWKNNLLEPRR